MIGNRFFLSVLLINTLCGLAFAKPMEHLTGAVTTAQNEVKQTSEKATGKMSSMMSQAQGHGTSMGSGMGSVMGSGMGVDPSAMSHKVLDVNKQVTSNSIDMMKKNNELASSIFAGTPVAGFATGTTQMSNGLLDNTNKFAQQGMGFTQKLIPGGNNSAGGLFSFPSFGGGQTTTPTMSHGTMTVGVPSTQHVTVPTTASPIAVPTAIKI